MERNSEQFYREFRDIVDGQFEPPVDRVAAFAADEEVMAILAKIPMDKNAMGSYAADFVQLEHIAIVRYGLSSQDVLKLVIDYWHGQQLINKESSEGTIE